MNSSSRRSFIGALTKLTAGFYILPSATLSVRKWKPLAVSTTFVQYPIDLAIENMLKNRYAVLMSQDMWQAISNDTRS